MCPFACLAVTSVTVYIGLCNLWCLYLLQALVVCDRDTNQTVIAMVKDECRCSSIGGQRVELIDSSGAAFCSSNLTANRGSLKMLTHCTYIHRYMHHSNSHAFIHAPSVQQMNGCKSELFSFMLPAPTCTQSQVLSNISVSLTHEYICTQDP